MQSNYTGMELEIETLHIKILTQNKTDPNLEILLCCFLTGFLLPSLLDLQTYAVLGLFVVVHKMMRHYCRDLNSRKLRNSLTPS